MKSWQQRERARATLAKKSATSSSRTATGCASPWRSRTPTSSGCRTSASRRSTGCSTRRTTSSASGSSCRRSRSWPSCCASGAPLVTLESQTPVRDFDVFAFSVSFEWDYTNVLTHAAAGGHAALRAARTHSAHPLVVIGGAVTFVNPEPLALFADVIAAGEGEVAGPVAGQARSATTAIAQRPAAAPGAAARLLHPVVLRRRSTAPTARIAALRAARRHRRAAGRSRRPR